MLSFDAYENLQLESEVFLKLKEAEADITGKRLSSKEILANMKKVLENV